MAFNNEDHKIEAKDTFWAAMSTIVVADAVMGIDNALGIAASANGNWWFIIFGLLISVPIIIFGSSVISRILNRWPDSVFIGSYVLFAVAVQMLLKEPVIEAWAAAMDTWVRVGLPWVTALVITALQYKKSGRL